MTTILEFLTARIAEDEEMAQACEQHAGADWKFVEYQTDRSTTWFAVDNATSTVLKSLDRPLVEHVAFYDPARVLRECAAKRAIIAAFREWLPDYDDSVPEALAPMAAIYSGHPDYQQEWA